MLRRTYWRYQWYRQPCKEKGYSVNLDREKLKVCLSVHYNGDDSFIFLWMGKMYKFKSDKNFSSQFFLGNTSEKCDTIKSKEISFKGSAYEFSVDYGSIDKSEV